MALSLAHCFGGSVYRIALIGESGAGKTSLLATLGAEGIAPADDTTTCQRIHQLPGKPNPPDKEIDAFAGTPGAISQDPKKAFHVARLRLNAAHEAMKKGEHPRTTQPDDPPLLALYRLTHPNWGRFTVEVVEYSGELLVPTQSSLDESRRRLTEFFDECDAVLLLAPAPRRGDPIGSPSKFRELLGAFQDWATRRYGDGAKVPVPVALAFSMWDRRAHRGVTPAERETGLGELVAEQRVHEGVVKTVQNSADRCKVFALSAFGQHLPQKAFGPAASDRPLGYPRNSYGVIEPFVWLCAQCDQIAEKRLADESEKLSWLKFWQFRHSLRTSTRAARVQCRCPEGTATHEMAGRFRSRATRLAIMQFLLCLLLLTGIGSAIEAVADDSQRKRAEVALSNPDSTDDQIVKASDWFAGYAASPVYRHVGSKWLALTSDEAAKKAREAQSGREARYWDRANASGLADETRESHLRDYLDKFPAGLHVPSAHTRLAEIDGRRAEIASREKCQKLRTAWNQTLLQIRGRFETIPAGDAGDAALTEAWKAYRELSRPPEPCSSPEDAMVYENLGRAITKARSDRSTDQQHRKWVEEEEKIEERLGKQDFYEAARLVQKSTSTHVEARSYRDKGFQAAVLDAMAKHRTNAEQSGQENALQNILNAIKKISADQVFEKFTDGAPTRAKVGTHISALEKALDRILYEKFTRNPREDTANDYLRSAPLKSMKPTVESFLNYKAGLKQPQQLRAKFRVNWNDWPDGYTTDIFLDVWDEAEGKWKNWISKRVESKSQGSTDTFESSDFPVVPTARGRFRVNIAREPTTFSPRPMATYEETEATSTFEELQQPKDGRLEETTGKGYRPTATISIVGVTKRPDLPLWKE